MNTIIKQVPAAHVATAIRALLDHAEKHDLPIPTSIDTKNPKHIWVHVDREGDQIGWLASLSWIHGHQEKRHGIASTYTHTEVTATLPDTGVRIRFTANSDESLLAQVGRAA